MKHPYTFPARSRKAMTDYLSAHASYGPAASWNDGFVLAWDIKCDYQLDTSGKHPDFDHTPAWDEEWALRTDTSEGSDYDSRFFSSACENALHPYIEGEWTNYPGMEQGEWKFRTNGRSDGWLILTDAPAWAGGPKGWASCPMTWGSQDEYEEWLAEMPFTTLKRFYRAVRVLDSDLSKANQAEAMAYQYGWLRLVWEEQRRKVLDRRATKMAEEIQASRPDMYEGAGP